MINEGLNVVAYVAEWLINRTGVKLKEDLMKEWVETMKFQNSKEEDYVKYELKSFNFLVKNCCRLCFEKRCPFIINYKQS